MSTNQRPLDITKLDFEGNRKRKRTHLIAWSLPVVVIIALFCLWLILFYVAPAQASTELSNGNTSAASGWLAPLKTNVFYEKYKLPFNKALVATQAKQFDTANELFREAATLAPESQRCFVHVQSVLSSELAGDDATNKKNYQEAITYYTKALSEISNHKPCFTAYNDLSTRINDKLTQAVNSLNQASQPTTSTDDSSGTVDTSALPTDKQLETLDQLSQQSQVRKRDGDSDSRQTHDTYTYTGKSW